MDVQQESPSPAMEAVFEAADAAQDATDCQGCVPPSWKDRGVAAITRFLRVLADKADGGHFSFEGGDVWTGTFNALADAIEQEWESL